MNTMTIRHIAASLIVIGALAGCTSKAPDTASDAVPLVAGKPTVAATPQAPEVHPVDVSTTIPDTADAIWKAIDQQSAELKTGIQSGDLKDVHHKAFAIRDLVAALPEHSPKLPADEQTKLQGEVKFVATLADRLDATGDANDKAGTQDNYDKLVAVLNGITRTK